MNCLICDDDVTERPSVLVDFEGSVEEVCDLCMEKADMPDVTVRLDINREGQPEFNGAFNVW